MASLSNYAENKTLNMWLRKEPVDVTTSYDVYMGLFKAETGLEENDLNTMVEVNEPTSYTRVRVQDFGGYSQSTSGESTNVNDVEFATALNDWGVITHTALMDAPTGGNVIMWGPLKNPREIFAGDAVRIRSGAHVIVIS